MKPVLTVEGKQYNNIDLQYRNGKLTCITAWDEDNKILPYYNANIENHSYVEKSLLLDFDKALKWEGRYNPIYDALDKMLEDKTTELQDLAIENIESQQPFTPNEIQKKYFYVQREQMGLMDAQEMVFEMMEEDVDLSGGEEE